MITNAVYDSAGYIVADIDGQTMTIPDDMANRERRKIAAWVAEGNVIAPYVPPAQTPDQIRQVLFAALPERIDLVIRLKTATPAQIDSWLATNVTTLAAARVVLATILKYLATNPGD